MIILGIESSCDETAVAIVENGQKVLSSLVSSQIKVHEKFGGVVPEVAAREHLKNISWLTKEALNSAQLKPQDLDLLAVTQGPGLIGALLVGVSFARGMACALRKPLVPVNHVHGHLHGAFLDLGKTYNDTDIFPCLALVISGGHSNLYYMQSYVHFELLAYTSDDACGECFDKVAKLLGLPYPGGPQIEKLAKDGDAKRFPMPKMLQNQTLAFSYSGLKTHIAYLSKSIDLKDPQTISDVCAGFQKEAFRQIVDKLQLAFSKKENKVNSVIVAGGVAANQAFRKILSCEISVPCLFPSLAFCSDNAAMIAASAFYEFNSKMDKNQSFEATWDAFSRYPFEKYSI